MKKTITTLVFISIWINIYGQDGSDVRYIKTQSVDSAYIGHNLLFDFFNRSFRGRIIDTVTISIDSEPIEFVEVRKDTGYNNWFSEQGFQSSSKIEGLTIRISKFKLNRITSKSFQVTIFVDYYDGAKLLPEKSKQQEYWFDKKDIAEVLIKSKQI